MKAALAFVLGLTTSVAGSSPAGTAGAPTPAAGRPWVLVQADGSRVVLEAPPRDRDGRLVGRLKGSGTLVSIPAARVDAAATERANVAGAETIPAPTVRPTPGPFETPPLGDRVRMNASGGDARRILESARTGTPAPAPPPGAAPTVIPVPEDAAPTDRLGRGEAYWRERAGAARGVLEEAEAAFAEAQARLQAAERSFLGVGEAERNSFIIRVIEARDVAEKARVQHRSAQGRWETLQEEARKAGAFPGWLR